MADTNRNNTAEIRDFLKDLFDSVNDLQAQIDEGTALQLAMISVLKDKVPNFESAVDAILPACEEAISEQNREIRESHAASLRRFGKWVQ